MAILQNELLMFKPVTVNNTPSNGGYRSNNEVARSAAQNLFSHVFEQERVAGSSVIRFGYVANHNANKETAENTKIWIDNETEADDYVYFVPRAQGDTQADITGSEQLYSVANLKTDVSAAGTTIVVEFPTADAVDEFSRTLTDSIAAAMQIRITNKQFPDSVAGTTEFRTVTGTPVVAGDEVSFVVTEGLDNAYTVAEGTRVSLVYEAGETVASFDTPVVTSAAGTVDEVVYPLEMDNIGTVEDTWTFLFSGPTNFTVSGARTGAVAAGVTTSTYAPENPDVSKPYLSVLAGFWGGTFANGDTVEITTRDSSHNIALNRVTPPNSSVFGTNRCTVGISCESV